MKLTKKQIGLIKKAAAKAESINIKAQNSVGALASLITEITGVECHADYLMGDGIGITPVSDGDTHIPIDDLIKAAENGIDINEEFLLDNLSI